MAKAKKHNDSGSKVTRRGIRFKPDPDTIARIDVKNAGEGKKSAFSPTLAALVTEESYRGCGLVTTMTKDLQVGDKIRVKLGPGPELLGEVRWRTELDSQVIRVGIMYLE